MSLLVRIRSISVSRLPLAVAAVLALLSLALPAFAQTGNSGKVQGQVLDPTGAVVPGATVELTNPVSGYKQSAQTDNNGQFTFTNVPFNNYHLNASKTGFRGATGDTNVRSTVPVAVNLSLQIESSSQTVTVEAAGADLVENEPSAHTDIDRSLYAKLPTESVNAPLSSLVTLSSPGIASDSNGLFHPLGEHADASFSVDGQPITDQQSRVFSNQLPVSAVESMEIINGVVPAEYGDKPSLIIRTTTRSGLNSSAHGSLSGSYGSFGTSNAGFSLGFGNKRFGNFISLDGVDSGRYLDTPEFEAIHAHGNGENFFDRIDFQPTAADSLHLNLGLSRSWFQTPNQYDQQALGQDQRANILSYNTSLVWTHLFGSTTLLSVNPYLRQDQFHYYPSSDHPSMTNPRRSPNPADMQNAACARRSLLFQGNPQHQGRAGVLTTHFLTEGFATGLTDPTFQSIQSCLNSSGAPVVDSDGFSIRQCAVRDFSKP
jgi:hypothetical protein